MTDSITQHVSSRGIAYHKRVEGEVLRAYRCPGGRWTVGSGLTAASGVIRPHAGMVITADEADRLLRLALAKTYEPRVARVLGQAPPHAFDGASSFDFNTGAIHKASWVGRYFARDWPGVRARLALWNKGGGRVLPGLERRRREEADIIIDNRWPEDLAIDPRPAVDPDATFAIFVLSMSGAEIRNVREALRDLGFEPGNAPGRVLRTTVTEFQTAYGLTVDGLIGRATLSTLQREIDARRKARRTGIGAAGGGAATGVNEAGPQEAITMWIGIGLLTAALIAAAWLAWHYRDLIAARVAAGRPRLAAWLRSF
jgi:lysozyme